jgi:hypothetical protein
MHNGVWCTPCKSMAIGPPRPLHTDATHVYVCANSCLHVMCSRFKKPVFRPRMKRLPCKQMLIGLIPMHQPCVPEDDIFLLIMIYSDMRLIHGLGPENMSDRTSR